MQTLGSDGFVTTSDPSVPRTLVNIMPVFSAAATALTCAVRRSTPASPEPPTSPRHLTDGTANSRGTLRLGQFPGEQPGTAEVTQGSLQLYPPQAVSMSTAQVGAPTPPPGTLQAPAELEKVAEMERSMRSQGTLSPRSPPPPLQSTAPPSPKYPRPFLAAAPTHGRRSPGESVLSMTRMPQEHTASPVAPPSGHVMAPHTKVQLSQHLDQADYLIDSVTLGTLQLARTLNRSSAAGTPTQSSAADRIGQLLEPDDGDMDSPRRPAAAPVASSQAWLHGAGQRTGPEASTSVALAGKLGGPPQAREASKRAEAQATADTKSGIESLEKRVGAFEQSLLDVRSVQLQVRYNSHCTKHTNCH